LESPSC